MKIISKTTKPCIYLITNLINNKKYVGQTVYLADRISAHKQDIRSKMAIDMAIKKYGEDNFSVEVLEEIPSYDKKTLDALEIKWIEKLDTYHNGYNNTRGGDGLGRGPKAKTVYQYSYDYKTLIKIYDSLNEAGHAVGGNFVTIRGCCLGDNGHGGEIIHAYNYGWTYDDITPEELSYRQEKTFITGFYAFELNNDKTIKAQLPKIYYIQADAAKELLLNAGSIKNILNGRAKTTRSKDNKLYTFKRLQSLE